MGIQALLRAFIIPEDFSFLLWMLAVNLHSISELGILQDLLSLFSERGQLSSPRHRTDPSRIVPALGQLLQLSVSSH